MRKVLSNDKESRISPAGENARQSEGDLKKRVPLSRKLYSVWWQCVNAHVEYNIQLNCKDPVGG